jgi:putative inorganic carbon (hco3(-)) transporter
VERLAFSYGTSRHHGEAPEPAGSFEQAPAPVADARPPAPAVVKGRIDEPRDWAFLGLMAFTGLLFFRPQDLITPLRVLHLAEIAALFALGSLISGRLSRGLALTRLTPELVGVLAFAFVILATAPFSVWMGGAVGTFTELYAKVVLIFVLMVNTLTSPRRMRQFIWLIVIASGYIGMRAVLDYARGINLVEHGRVQGSIGGMFKNPNDLALNMVAVLPLAVFLVLQPVSMLKRGLAAFSAAMMLGAIVASHSRSGTVGLAAMILVLGAQLLKRKPGLVMAVAFAGLLALPVLPSSYWQRLASITNENLDETGSREARSVLLHESFDAFVTHPFTGVGAGQFKNYNPEGREEAWRESHNVVLQVAAELGIAGLAVFVYLVIRAFLAPMQARRLLRAAAPGRRSSRNATPVEPGAEAEYEMLTLYTVAVTAALAGWFVCALFASVAYHWTFYYLLALAVAPRDYLLARAAAARSGRRAAAAHTVAAVGAHA